MKLMVLNLNTYQEDNQIKKFNHIASKIVEEQIDVICFCEAGQTFMSPRVDEYVRQDNAVKLICDEVNRILGDKVYQFVWDLSHYGFKIYEEGIAIMSKYPLKDVASQYVSNTHDIFTFKSRKIVKATLTYKNKDIDIFSCQLGWSDDKYEPFDQQFIRLDAWVKESATSSFVLLAGDFSNDVSTAAYQQIIDAGYHDQYLLGKKDGLNDETFIYPQGYESSSPKKALRLDYIFATNNAYPVKNATRFFQGDDRVSDHMAVMVEWDIEE